MRHIPQRNIFQIHPTAHTDIFQQVICVPKIFISKNFLSRSKKRNIPNSVKNHD